MSIYAKEQVFKQQKRKLEQSDQSYMKQAEDLLFGEIAVALEISIDEVQEYIASRVAVSNKEQGQRRCIWFKDDGILRPPKFK